MVKLGKIFALTALLLIFIFNSKIELLQSIATDVDIFSDNFDDDLIDLNHWTIFSDPGVGVEERNGTLNEVILFLEDDGTTWKQSGVNKTLNSSIRQIELEFSFDFKSMGGLYLTGESYKNKRLWLVGLRDRWSGSNTRPIIYGYDTNGTYNPSISYNNQDITTNKMTSSSGEAHVRIQFDSSTALTFNFSFPTLINGANQVSHSLLISGKTDLIQLLFYFPPSVYYASGSFWKFDNYQEKTEIETSEPIETSNTIETSEPIETSNTIETSGKSESTRSIIITTTSGFTITFGILAVSLVTIRGILRKRKR